MAVPNQMTQIVGPEAVLSERRKRMLFGALFGTGLAGGVYGAILYIWNVVTASNFQVAFETIGAFFIGACQLLLACFVVFAIGAAWAFYVAIPVSLILFGISYALKIEDTPVWIASCIGGLTAFFCCGGFEWLPNILGQVGAWAIANQASTYNVIPKYRPQPIERDNLETKSRYGLSQLLRLLTVACIVCGLLSLLKLSEQFWLEMGYCVLWQAISIPATCWLLRTAFRVPRETVS